MVSVVRRAGLYHALLGYSIGRDQQRAATGHNRRADRSHIGTTLTDPNIDYAKMAESFGVYGEGPISDPSELRAALARGIERVKGGEPALIDVVTQPR